MTLYAKYMILDDSAHGTWHLIGLHRETERRKAQEER